MPLLTAPFATFPSTRLASSPPTSLDASPLSAPSSASPSIAPFGLPRCRPPGLPGASSPGSLLGFPAERAARRRPVRRGAVWRGRRKASGYPSSICTSPFPLEAGTSPPRTHTALTTTLRLRPFDYGFDHDALTMALRSQLRPRYFDRDALTTALRPHTSTMAVVEALHGWGEGGEAPATEGEVKVRMEKGKPGREPREAGGDTGEDEGAVPREAEGGAKDG